MADPGAEGVHDSWSSLTGRGGVFPPPNLGFVTQASGMSFSSPYGANGLT